MINVRKIDVSDCFQGRKADTRGHDDFAREREEMLQHLLDYLARDDLSPEQRERGVEALKGLKKSVEDGIYNWKKLKPEIEAHKKSIAKTRNLMLDIEKRWNFKFSSFFRKMYNIRD